MLDVTILDMTKFGIVGLTTYILGTIAVILLPGPNSLYALSVAVAHGTRKGYRAVTGVLVGDTILILITVLGVGGLLKLYPALFHGIKIIGGLYLMYLGVKLFIGAYATLQRVKFKQQRIRLNSKVTQDAISQEAINQASVNNEVIDNASINDDNKALPVNQNYFYRALLLSLTNPKAILFFLSFFVQFVDPNYPHPLWSFFILALILQFISLSYLSLLVIAGERLAQKAKQYPMLVVFSMVSVGVLFIGFAIKLWLAQIE